MNVVALKVAWSNILAQIKLVGTLLFWLVVDPIV